jgi:small subunit ribosomal protein S6
MQIYELMVILKVMLPDETREAAQNKIIKMVKDLGGKVTNTDVWGKRHLAYQIKGVDEGYYIVFNLELPNDEAKALNDKLQLDRDILRFMLTKVD